MDGVRWPKVTVAVLNRNGSGWLPECLVSLLNTDYPNLEVLVVDNGSSDGSVQIVRQRFPTVSVMALDENLGFTGAYNRVFQSVHSPYILLLNNDTKVVEPQWVHALVKALEGDPSAAAATCRILYLHRPDCINSLGGRAYWWTGSYDIADGENDDEEHSTLTVEPFCFCGAAALLRMSAVREVNGFDDAMFAYREDVDLSWRLRLRGYRIVYVREAVVLHAGGGSWGPLSYGKLYLSSRNWLRAMLKNYSLPMLTRGLPAFFLFELLVRLPGIMLVNRSLRYALVPFHVACWHVAHLGSTIRERNSIGQTRRVSDRVILKMMGPAGFEPLWHLRQRAAVLQEVRSARTESRQPETPASRCENLISEESEDE